MEKLIPRKYVQENVLTDEDFEDTEEDKTTTEDKYKSNPNQIVYGIPHNMDNNFQEDEANDFLVYHATFANTYRTAGQLVWYNSSGKPKASYEAVSGASNIKHYTIPETLDLSLPWKAFKVNLAYDALFARKGVSFRVHLGPDRYDKKRQYTTKGDIRIHPARSNGTEGCIGLISDDRSVLLDFKQKITDYINKFGSINVYVPDYTNSGKNIVDTIVPYCTLEKNKQ